MRRVLAALITDPGQSWLRRHRMIDADGAVEFVVVINTPTGADHDAAVFWRFLDDGSAHVLAIELEYTR